MIKQKESHPQGETPLEQVKKSILAATIGSCDCNTKTPNAIYHAAHCRYLKLLQALDCLDAVLGNITDPYEIAGRQAGWTLIPDENGGRFERSASDEPELVWLCGNWKELCEFAAIEVTE